MKQLLNTLYVMTQGAYVHIENDTLRVDVDRDTKMRVPFHHIGSIVAMGNVLLSPFLLGKCADEGRSVTILDQNGRFKCRIEGPVSGNVLLRHAHFEKSHDDAAMVAIASAIVAGKLKNSRTLLMREARESDDPKDEQSLRESAALLAELIKKLPLTEDVNCIRGYEGEGSHAYFSVFTRMIKPPLRKDFAMNGRNKRPPRDRLNALLSFLYTLLLHDTISAVEGVGLDAQTGFLHVLRPGRPAMGLDLMEEFRAMVADKLALTLINRRQISPDDFEIRPGGAVYLNENGRKTVIVAYQKRKQEELHHPLLKEKIPIGLLPHVQARLLARHIRGEAEHYIPMVFA